MEIRLLGSGGFIPSDRRDTACALVRDGDQALLIDAGTGARRLLLDRGLLDGVAALRVVLTHFHLDHTMGLFCLVDLDVDLEVWGAGETLERIPTAELVGRLLGTPFAPPAFVDELGPVRELDVGAAQVGPFTLRTRVQRLHSNPTLALRIGDELAWCTDTAYDVENVEFVRGVRLLCHEAFLPQEPGPGHTSAAQAAELAAAAGVDRLVLIHVNPEADDEEALVAAARPRFTATEVARDGAVL
jgi:ribonuclease BN (tRNA processing enzyme)